MKHYYVYIVANWNNKVIYVGVTNDLVRRDAEHKNKTADGFTKRYNVNKLVYFEQTDYIHAALNREKEIKGWIRAKKNALIEGINPDWRDLSEDFK